MTDDMTPLDPVGGPSPAEIETGAILRRTAHGASWIVGWRMATRMLGLCSTLILARLLLPSDFGLVALATVFVASLDALSLLGVEDALIRLKNPARDVYDTAFTMNLIRGTATAAILLAASPQIAHFFKEPRLANILYALAAGSVIVGFHNIGCIEFRRQIAFNKEFKLFVVPRMCTVLVTVTNALIFRSYWALIAGILTGRFMLTAYSYVLHPFRPRFTLAAWRELAGFSFWTWLLGMVSMVRDRTDGFFIGRTLDTRSVGMFSVATEIGSLPLTEFVIPLGTATFAGFSAARHAGASPGQTYLRVIGATVAVTTPAGFGISLLADPIVRLALGPHWLQAVPVIEVGAALGTTYVFGSISSSLFSAHSYLSVLFRVAFASMIVRVSALFVLVPRYGIIGATFAGGLGMFVEYGAYAVLTCRRFSLTPASFVGRIARPLAATAIMVACLAALHLGWTAQPGPPLFQFGRLIAGSAAGAVLYTASLAALWVLSGRPQGAETDLAGLLQTVLARLRARRTATPSIAPPAQAH